MSTQVTKQEWARLRERSRQVALDDVVAKQLGAEQLPDVLLPYQALLLRTTAENEVTVVEKSRRTGITWGAAADAVLTSAASRSAGGMDTLYIGYNLDMAREFIDVCGMWAKAFHPAASSVEEFLFKDRDGDRDIKAFRIAFASGFEIVALSSKPRSLRGRQGYVIIDEAAFHDDLNELLKAALALLIWGGKVLVISTHDGDRNPFNALVQDIRKGRTPYALIALDFDQALHDGLYKRICLVTGQEWTPQAEAEWREKIIEFYGDAADEELYVIPATGTGTFLPGLLIERQQQPGIPVVRLERGDGFLHLPDQIREAEIRDWCDRELLPLLERANPTLPSVFGHDYARSGDLSVNWPAQVGQDMVRRPLFVLEMWNMPYAQQRQVVWYIVDRLPNFLAGAIDATGNGSSLAEETATRYGLERIARIHITEGWYREVMPRFKADFEDGKTVLPQNLDVYNDHRAIKLVRGVAQVMREEQRKGKGEGKGRTKKRHGDTAIAHLLANEASRTDVEVYAYTPVRPAITGRDDDHYSRQVRVTGGFTRGSI